MEVIKVNPICHQVTLCSEFAEHDNERKSKGQQTVIGVFHLDASEHGSLQSSLIVHGME